MREFFKEIVTIPCECGAEKITIEVENNPPCADWAYFSIWTQRLHSQYTLGMKIRHILQIVRDGSPYTDMMLLNANDCERLASACTEAAAFLRANKKTEQDQIEERRKRHIDEDGWSVDSEGFKWMIEDYDDSNVMVRVLRPDGKEIRNIVSRHSRLTKE